MGRSEAGAERNGGSSTVLANQRYCPELDDDEPAPAVEEPPDEDDGKDGVR
jgi:hypothetical protein